MTPPLLTIDGLWLSHDGGASFTLRSIDLSVATGAFVAIVGRSGSGKTTLLKCINRLVVPDRGLVRIEGAATTDLPAHELRRRIGYAFQGSGLFPHMSVAENIAITPRLLGWPAAEVALRVGELLDLVELPRDIAARAPRDLSGGQQQRVGLARALAARPKLMLLDEPFGALDPITRDSLGLAYRKLHDELGLTTLMVTHDLEEALFLCDRVVVVEAGAIRADGRPDELMASEDPFVAGLVEVPRRKANRLIRQFGG